MRSRRLILGLIILTLLATCLLAAAKLRATPKYDRIQVGMTRTQVLAILESPPVLSDYQPRMHWYGDEGLIALRLKTHGPPDAEGMVEYHVIEKNITRRGPLERLAWLLGWRSDPRFPPSNASDASDDD